MREVLEELRLEKLARGLGENPVEPLLLLATELAHLAPLYRTFLARAIYDLYGKEPERLLPLYRALAHQVPKVEREDPLLQRILGGGFREK